MAYIIRLDTSSNPSGLVTLSAPAQTCICSPGLVLCTMSTHGSYLTLLGHLACPWSEWEYTAADVLQCTPNITLHNGNTLVTCMTEDETSTEWQHS